MLISTCLKHFMRTSLTLFFSLALSFHLMAQCVDCTPAESCISEVLFPRLCPEVAPDATAGEYYEETLTFFLPPQIVDPDTELSVDLNTVTINQVSGLPFGLAFQLSEEDNTYEPANGQNLGCATVCGTPLLPGDYSVTVFVTAEVSLLGFPSTVEESFTQALTVLPGEVGNPSFSIDVLAACDSLSVNLSALIDGSPGITDYSWDFGNGFGSDMAQPEPIVYTQPGDYTIGLSTIISDYTIQSISVSNFDENWAGDVEEFSTALAPDPFFLLIDGDNNVAFTSPILTDVFSASWNDLGLVLDTPPYSIEFYDDDLFSEVDFLGSASVSLSSGVLTFSASGTSGFISIELLETANFYNEEVVSVFPTPNPIISYDEETELLSAAGEDLDSYIWFLNGDTIPAAVSPSITAETPGIYQVQASNLFGCEGRSEEIVVCPDPEVSFDEEDDVIYTQEGFSSYEWSYNGLPLDGFDSAELPFQGLGNYAVEISTAYGCLVESEVFILSTDVAERKALDWSIYPNPARSEITVEGLYAGEEVRVQIFNNQGELVKSISLNTDRQLISIRELSAGAYSFFFVSGDVIQRKPFIVLR